MRKYTAQIHNRAAVNHATSEAFKTAEQRERSRASIGQFGERESYQRWGDDSKEEEAAAEYRWSGSR